MKIIFIRGVPGTGKTTISKILEKMLPNCEFICVDDFKDKNPKDDQAFKDSLDLAYEHSITKLHVAYEKNRDYVILEEIICDESFYKKLKDFVIKTNSKDHWIRLMRRIRNLLEEESKRNRKIKNSKEDFDKLKREIDYIKIKNEHLIKNDTLALTFKRILDIVY